MTFSLTPDQWGEAPAGRDRLRRLPPPEDQLPLIMDRAYEGDAARQLAMGLGFGPVVPPKKHRRQPWSYNEPLYRRRNEIERLLKAFRRIFSLFDKLEVMFTAFIHFALIDGALRPRLA